MSVGKSSINRISKAKTEGIRSLAPEVPAGDAAAPVAEVKKPATKKPAVKKTSQAPKKEAPAVTKFPAYIIGQELPYWLL